MRLLILITIKKTQSQRSKKQDRLLLKLDDKTNWEGIKSETR